MLNDSRYADSGNARKEIERQAEALYKEADKLEFGDTPPGDELYF